MELNTGDKKLSPTNADMLFQSHNFKLSIQDNSNHPQYQCIRHNALNLSIKSTCFYMEKEQKYTR